MTVELNTPSTLADLIDKELMGVEPDSQCVVLDDADWKMITAALRSSTPEFTRCVECDGYNCDDGCAYPNATPAPAELVRYTFKPKDQIDQMYMRSSIVECTKGEYVLYDQAAALIAELKALLQYERDQQVHEELASVKAELAQIKAQVPVLWARINEDGKVGMVSGWPTARINTPLYAAPVASEAEAIERLREALEKIEIRGYVAPKDAPSAHDEVIDIARAALCIAILKAKEAGQ